MGATERKESVGFDRSIRYNPGMTKADVMAGALRLSPAERLELVEELWETIAEAPESVPLTDELRRELDRRLAEDDASPTDVIPWEDIKREIEGL